MTSFKVRYNNDDVKQGEIYSNDVRADLPI